MKTAIWFSAAFLACAALFFFAAHHRRRGEVFKSCTLAEDYGSIIKDIDEFFQPRAVAFLLLALSGIFAAFFPAILVLMARWQIPAGAKAGGLVFVSAAVIAIVGIVSNFVLMVLSHMNFGFGVSQSHDETPFIFLLPIFQAVFAIASLVIAFSATVAGWARQFVV